MGLLSFDIEISDIFDLRPGQDINDFAPFHLAVASTAIHEGEERVWYSTDGDGRPLENMTSAKARELLEYLADQQAQGAAVAAWNGLGFDLQWIGYHAQDMALAARVALDSYDPMFQFFNQRGFPVGLAAVGEAMGIKQEKIMTGADAPKEWKAGNHDRVMEYVMGDSQITNAIILAIQKHREVRWRTRNGAIRSERMPKLKPVRQVLAEPVADQSWMSTPIPKKQFYEWLIPHVPNLAVGVAS